MEEAIARFMKKSKEADVISDFRFNNVDDATNLLTTTTKYLSIIGTTNSGKTTFIQYLLDNIFVPYDNITIGDSDISSSASFDKIIADYKSQRTKFYIYSGFSEVPIYIPYKKIISEEYVNSSKKQLDNLPGSVIFSSLGNLIVDAQRIIEESRDYKITFVFDNLDILVHKNVTARNQFNLFMQLIQLNTKQNINVIVSGTDPDTMMRIANPEIFKIIGLQKFSDMKDTHMTDILSMNSVLPVITAMIKNLRDITRIHRNMELNTWSSASKQSIVNTGINTTILYNYINKLKDENLFKQVYSCAFGFDVNEFSFSCYNFLERNSDLVSKYEVERNANKLSFDFKKLYKNVDIVSEKSSSDEFPSIFAETVQPKADIPIFAETVQPKADIPIFAERAAANETISRFESKVDLPGFDDSYDNFVTFESQNGNMEENIFIFNKTNKTILKKGDLLNNLIEFKKRVNSNILRSEDVQDMSAAQSAFNSFMVKYSTLYNRL